jgi:hypothetical protein
MLIIGNSLGRIDSLNLNTKTGKNKYDLENLISIDNFSINKIYCNRFNEIFFSSINGTLGFLNKKTKKLVKNKNLSDTELSTYHTFNNGTVVAFYTNYIRIWKKHRDKFFFCKKKLICHKKFNYVVVNKSENFFLTTSFFENQIYLWSLLEDKIVLGGKYDLKEFIVSLKGANRDIFTIGTHTGSIYIYSVNGELIRSIKKNSSDIKAGKPDLQKAVAWFDNNTFFSGKSSGKVEMFDLRCFKSNNSIKGHSCEVSHIDVSNNILDYNPFFLASSDILGNLKLWDIRNSKELYFQKKFNSKITSLSFS